MPVDVPATTDLYVDPAALKATIGRDDDAADGDIALACRAASRAIDELASGGGGEICRRFWRSAQATERLYTANVAGLVVIDDAASIDSVVSDGAVVTDYLAQPLNATAKGRPITRLTTAPGAFSTAPGNIAVTAVWGWPVVPHQVLEMATIVASKLLKRVREAPFGVVNVGGLDGAAVRLAREDPDVQLLLKPLVRFPVAVA